MQNRSNKIRQPGIPAREPDLRSISTRRQDGIDSGSRNVEAQLGAEFEEEGERPNLWEKQPWESNTAYQNFAEFYLPQPTPRRVLEAYRRRGLKRGKTGAQISAISSVPGFWNRWAYSLDRQGRRIPNTHTWAERARARDAYLIYLAQKEDEEAWRTRRKRIHELEFAVGEKLMERAARMQAKVLFEQSEHNVIKVGEQEVPQSITYSPGDWSERDIARTAKIASELMRRGVDLPVGKPEADWRRELTQQFPDLDPDEVQIVIVNALLDFLHRRKQTI